MSSNLTIRKMQAGDVALLDQQFIKQNWPSRKIVLTHYLAEQQSGERLVLIALFKSQVAGYVTLMTLAKAGPLQGMYPEIADFNVFEQFQKFGIGGQLLTAIENAAQPMTKLVTLGVGLHSGYGPAQRLYVKHGFIPDGSGVWYNNRPLAMNAPCFNDNELVLYLSKSI